MKFKIEVNVPDGVDLEHAIESVTDALYLPDNVTQQEYDLVLAMLDKLIVERDKIANTNEREYSANYRTTSVSQIATQIKNMVEKIRQYILDGRKDLVLDWDSNEIEFSKGYIATRLAPNVIIDDHKFLLQPWEDSSDLIKQLYWKATSFDYVFVSVRRGTLIIQLCQNIESEYEAKKFAFGNYQKSIYDCKENKFIVL